MSGLTSCYGRSGSQADSDPRVAELLKRSVNGQYEALSTFDQTLAALHDNGHAPWNAPGFDLTLLNQLWLTKVCWERATVFLDAMVSEGVLDNKMCRQTDILCDQASGSSLKAIALRTDMTQGSKPGLRQPERLSLPPLTQANCTAMWAVISNIVTRTLMDLTEIKRTGVPPAMQEALRTLEASVMSKMSAYDHLQGEWEAAVSIDNRMRTVSNALPLAEHYHAAGQQVWTPYMLGRVYTDVLRVTRLFDRLQLGFDPWILTDPAIAEQKATDLDTCKQLASFWETIGDPSSAHSLQAEVTRLYAQGVLTIQPGRTYRTAPWHPHYLVQAAVTIGETTLEEGNLFSLYPRGSAGQRTLEIRIAG